MIGILVLGLVGCLETTGVRPPNLQIPDPSPHPCADYRVNTLLAEDDTNVFWLGCGEGSAGFGLFHSEDAGTTWSSPQTLPPDYFETFRVMSIQRAADDFLYVAGTQSPGSDMVVQVDTRSFPFTVTPILERGNLIGTTFSVGTFLRNSEGVSVAESLTGTDVMARASDSQDFEVIDSPLTDGSGLQILDLELDSDDFYGVGSTIADPHVVMLPPGTPDAVFALQPVSFETIGTLWDLSVHDGQIFAAGVEEEENFGIIYTSGADAYNVSMWSMTDARTVVGDGRTTRFYGTCRRGDVLIALGDYSQSSDGLALLSRDGGASWTDITPQDSPILGECAIRSDGVAFIFGGRGHVSIHDVN